MSLGHFIIIWGCFEELLEVYIQRRSSLSLLNATIILSGLGFERKASIARSFMSLDGDAMKDARALVNKIVAVAERNALVHGQILSITNAMVIAKRTTDQNLRVRILTFTPDSIGEKVRDVTRMVTKLQSLLGITNADIERYEKTTHNLASKSATSPKPPSS